MTRKAATRGTRTSSKPKTVAKGAVKTARVVKSIRDSSEEANMRRQSLRPHKRIDYVFAARGIDKDHDSDEDFVPQDDPNVEVADDSEVAEDDGDASEVAEDADDDGEVAEDADDDDEVADDADDDNEVVGNTKGDGDTDEAATHAISLEKESCSFQTRWRTASNGCGARMERPRRRVGKVGAIMILGLPDVKLDFSCVRSELQRVGRQDGKFALLEDPR
ncbi:hypothetical protein PRNP1_014412 [Phytophthora ramorum]